MGPKKNPKHSDDDKKDFNDEDIHKLDEALEEGINLDEEEQSGSEVSGEDLLEEMEKDYKAIPELDKYDVNELDEEEYSDLDVDARKKAEEDIDRRKLTQKFKGKRIPKAVLDELDQHSDDEELRRKFRMTQMKFTTGVADEEISGMEGDLNFINNEDVKGNTGDWLDQPHVIRFIQLSFTKFIKNYKDTNDNNLYENRIIEMCSSNKKSLEVNFTHLTEMNQNVGMWTIQYPKKIIPILNDKAFSLTCEIFPQYKNIATEIYIRFRDLPVKENLRDLRSYQLDSLLTIRGVVTKRSSVYPQLKKVYFNCKKCGDKKGPYFYNGNQEALNLGSCLICQSSGAYELDLIETIYRNYQKVTVQESPGSVPPGRIPRHKEIILTNDLVDSVRPGDEVDVTGVYTSTFDMSTNIRNGFPVFSTFIEANHMKKLNELEIGELTDEDKIEIKKLAKNPNIPNMIFDSIAPSIYGNLNIKRALALAMFGGVSKDINGKHRIRGDINVLLLGDPGTAKSQFLKYCQKVFHRSVYTTGKGASAVGLTAGVHKDPITQEWVLEGGALVLSDKGICMIDEFDKMNDQDRTSIHEAMEQQSISISKAGIVTTLQARCSVIAAANPIKGRYDNQLTFSDNVDLTDPILSRFDILCVVKDEVDVKIDNSLATFVINSHICSHPLYENDDNISLEDTNQKKKDYIPQEILRKYIMYARKFITPKLSDPNKNKVSKFYSELRKESELVGGITIAVRHLESLLRIAESHAKMHLRDHVRSDDIDLAIKVMLESFLQSQKYSISKNLRKKFSQYLTMQEDTNQLLMNTLTRMEKENLNYMSYFKKIDYVPNEISIKKDLFEREAKELGIFQLEEFYESSLFKARHQLIDQKIVCEI